MPRGFTGESESEKNIYLELSKAKAITDSTIACLECGKHIDVYGCLLIIQEKLVEIGAMVDD